MGDGVNKTDDSPSNQTERSRQTSDGQRDKTPTEFGQITTENLAPADDIVPHCLEEVYSPQEASAARTQDNHQNRNLIGDALLAVLPISLQLPPAVDKYGEANYDPHKQAELLYANIADPAKRAELIAWQEIADKAIMQHRDYLPQLRDTNTRVDLMAYALGNGDDAQCKEIRSLVGEYWKDVLLAGSAGRIQQGGLLANDGRLLDPHSAKLIDPANPNLTEGKLWATQAEILAKLNSLLVKDDNSIFHPEQIDRYNPDPKFRPLDEPIPPPPDFNHHLPEAFSAEIFRDASGQPRIFNVKELCRQETLSNIKGEVSSGLDPQERAVLALHTEVLEQVRPWWLVADGGLIRDDATRANRNACRDNILSAYVDDFQKFDLQIAACQQNPDWQQRWQQFKIQSVTQIPSTAQAMHFAATRDLPVLTQDNMKKTGWDTRRLTDAELARETIRLAQWRHLMAVQSFVQNGLTKPLAQVTKQDAELPFAMLINARAIISKTNSNDFRDPNPAVDPARRFATRQLINDFSRNVQFSNPSVLGFNDLASDQQINTWVQSNLTRWKDHGYPWPLAYVYNHNTNSPEIRARRNALEGHRQLECANYNQTRILSVDVDNRPQSLNGRNVPGVSKADRDAQTARDNALRANRPVEKAAAKRKQEAEAKAGVPPGMQSPLGVCKCTDDYEQQNVDPFRAYNLNKDPMRFIYELVQP